MQNSFSQQLSLKTNLLGTTKNQLFEPKLEGICRHKL